MLCGWQIELAERRTNKGPIRIVSQVRRTEGIHDSITSRSATLQQFSKKKQPGVPRSRDFPKRNTQKRHAPGLHKKENMIKMTRKEPVTLKRKPNDRKTPNLGAKKTPASTKYRKLVYICLKRPAYSKTDTCRFCFQRLLLFLFLFLLLHLFLRRAKELRTKLNAILGNFILERSSNGRRSETENENNKTKYKTQ